MAGTSGGGAAGSAGSGDTQPTSGPSGDGESAEKGGEDEEDSSATYVIHAIEIERPRASVHLDGMDEAVALDMERLEFRDLAGTRSDIARQQALASHYAAEREALDDEEARDRLARIQAHDEYQVGQLEDLLRAAEAGEFDAPEREIESSAAGAESAEAPGGPRFTVGSLFGRAQDA